MNKILALIFVLIFPIHAYAGFPEGETGYELKKIEQSFKLPCSEIGKDKCLARVISMGGCIYSFEINKGINNEDALRKSDEVLISLFIDPSFAKILFISRLFPSKSAIKTSSDFLKAVSLSLPLLISKL